MIGERAYEFALKRRDQLREELARNQRELDEVQDFLTLCERYATYAGDAPAQPKEVIFETVSASKPVRRKLATVSGMDLLPYIRAAILEIGRPLKRGAIVRALEERGIRVGGEEPARNIGTIMWRAKTERGEFETIERLGYWPADVAYPPAGYDPSSEDRDETDDESEPERQGQDFASEPSEDWEQAAQSA